MTHLIRDKHYNKYIKYIKWPTYYNGYIKWSIYNNKYTNWKTNWNTKIN
jgi:hypothetical protein